jgi:tetratricopeptide (TPR) repeat protein
VNYQELWQTLTLPEGEKPYQPYIDCLVAGRKHFDERWGADDPADATMLWWLGWAHLSAAEYEAGEEAFVRSVVKVPTFLNSYWYAGLCQYYLKDYAQAAAHWARYHEGNPDDLTKTIQSNVQENVAIVFFTQGQLAAKGEQDWPGQRDAAVLGEMLVRAEPKNWQRWNDLGLFCRNAGANLPDSEKGAARRRGEYWLRAREAYEVAMGLAPDMPHLYNDCAVILHYYLDTDLELAKELYEKALDMATKQLDEGNLEGDALNLAQIAKRDAANNLARLQRKLDGDDDEEGDGR